jgi:hypothetical protein
VLLAIIALAPVRFSTIIDCPNAAFIGSLSSRAEISTPPPAA